jgi:radical SAM superfamily enzyme YgiQ (UPF0313 family)
MNNGAVSERDLAAAVARFAPDIIGISVKTATLNAARKTGSLLRSIRPDIPIIVGGAHATVAGQMLIKEPWVDIVLSGECEATLPELCTRLMAGDPVSEIAGVFTRQQRDEDRQSYSFILHLDELQYPDYSLFPGAVQDTLRTGYPLVTSRGCAFQCVYCSVPLISGRRFRKRSPEKILDELRGAVSRYGVRAFEIIDDAFNLDMDRAKEFCRQLIQSDLRLFWSCPNGLRADRVDKELAMLMHQAGCRSIMVGIESAVPDVLASIHKGETIEDIEQGIRRFQKAGIRVGGYFIIGAPGDSYRAQEKNVEFIRKTGITAHFNMLIPYPGTALWEWTRAHARYLADIEEGLHFSDSVDKVQPVFETDDFTAADRRKAYTMVHTRIRHFDMVIPRGTTCPCRVARVLHFLWTYDRMSFAAYPLRQLLNLVKRLFHDKKREGERNS